MICPICKSSLEQFQLGKVTVDICNCCGIWFDTLELQNAINQNNSSIIGSIKPSDTIYKVECEQIYGCPKCITTKMLKRYFVKRKVLADQCPRCGGIWLEYREFCILCTETISQSQAIELENDLKSKKRQKVYESLKRQEEKIKEARIKLKDAIKEMIYTANESLELMNQKYASKKSICDISQKDHTFKENTKLAVDITNEIQKMVKILEENNNIDSGTLSLDAIDNLENRFKQSVDNFESRLHKL